eukprot:7511318-Alexandrium_andersonii.AAC.2
MGTVELSTRLMRICMRVLKDSKVPNTLSEQVMNVDALTLASSERKCVVAAVWTRLMGALRAAKG